MNRENPPHSMPDQVDDRVTTIRVGDKAYRMFLPEADTDYIQGLLARTQTPYEADMLDLMARRLKPNDLVLDVGANIGNHTLFLAAIVGCRVHAFEPSEKLCEALRRSLALNGLDHLVEVHQVAVGASSGFGDFEEYLPDNRGAQRIRIGRGTIPLVTLDSMRFDKKVACVKIDVEGMEMDVLRGAKTVLQQDRPELYVECFDESAFQRVSTWLEEMRYTYWDTFNATPTHLFLPEESVTLKAHLGRARAQAARDRYKTAIELQKVRDRLHDANLKYRAINEQVTKLKDEVNHHKSARQAAEARSEALEMRLAELRDERNAAAQALLGLQSRCESLTAEYRAINEQVTKLKDEVNHHKSARQAAEARSEALEMRLAELRDERNAAAQALLGLQSRCESLTAEYRAINEQVTKLKDEVNHHKSARQAAEARSEALEMRLAELRDERNAAAQALLGLQSRCESLTAENAKLEAALSGLEEKWKATKLALDRANDKYRAVTRDQIPVLKSQLTMRTSQAEQLREEIERLKKALRDTEASRLAAAAKIAAIQASRTYQLACQLRDAVRSPRALLRLPGVALRLAREARRAKARKRYARKADKEKTAAFKKALRAARPTSRAWTPPERRSNNAISLLPEAGVPRRPLKVACILDDFSYACFAPEARLKQITPHNWREELEAFKPDMLLVESAWRGKDELWKDKIGHLSEELNAVLDWCNAHNVPTAFWNKEDPVHFQTFLNTARLFDCVFTTDIDCVHLYKRHLGHDRVYLLPFACQPALHNPIEVYRRKDAISFAGAYYARYPERARDLETLLGELMRWRPVEIYDRNYGKDDPRYRFPDHYKPFIVGTLPFERIDQAYKGYRYAINMNSIKHSQSMFARRVFELLASNTLVISNYSRGLRVMFGDLVVSTDSGAEAVRRLEVLSKDPERSERIKLMALRKVMLEHTYGDRIEYIRAKLFNEVPSEKLPAVAIIARCGSKEEARLLVQAVQRQRYPRAKLYLICSDVEAATSGAEDERIEVLSEADVRGARLGDLAAGAEWVCGMVAADYYGPNYLLDLALATTYSRAKLIGKSTYFKVLRGQVVRVGRGEPYTPVSSLPARQSIAALEFVGDELALDWARSLPRRLYHGAEACLAIDPYNYCRSGAHAIDGVVQKVDDLPDVDTGISLAELQRAVTMAVPDDEKHENLTSLDAPYLARLFEGHQPENIDLALDGSRLNIRSSLPFGKHAYLYATKTFDLHELSKHDSIQGYLDITPGLNVSLVILFLDNAGNRIGHVIEQANRNFTINVPPRTSKLRLGLRIYQGGMCNINALDLAHRNLEPPVIFGRSRVLLLTNHYPSYDDLYRNGFVHSRVRAYRDHGVQVDVFRLRPHEPIAWHEFEGVDVTTGSQTALRRLLSSGRYERVAVHFLSSDMWQVLQEFIDRIEVIAWVHGAEIDPWWRRRFDIKSPEDEARLKQLSESRVAFWKSILRPMHKNLHLVFVSRSYAKEKMDDYGITFPEGRISIIHNPIDTKLFEYIPKSKDQRFRVLSIRPYSNHKYANDLSVRAIALLSKEPEFNRLHFKLIGDGPLFDETVAPLRRYKNVSTERRFLTQREIAQMHREYGIFLCPTRYDSQGVSRDEAMASGLVPVTTRIAAVPEFVDENCGVLAEPESPESLAEGILSLVRDPEKFIRLSRNAAERVRLQSAADKIIEQELALLRGPSGVSAGL